MNAARNTQRVALVLTIAGWHSRSVLLGIAQYLRGGRKWDLEIYPQTLAGFELLRRSRPDGAIIRNYDPAALPLIRDFGGPVVDISQEDWPGLPRVTFDNRANGAAAATHFLDRGLRHLAFFSLSGGNLNTHRYEGFRDRARESNVDVAFFQSQGDENSPALPGSRTALDKIDRWLSALPKPVGILTPTDEAGLQLLQVCRRVGLRSPTEVAVVGMHDDKVICELADPALSSVRTAGERMGYEAALLLDQIMHGAPVPAPIVLGPMGVTTRASSDVFAVDDPLVRSAMQFIQSHVNEPIGVDDVADGIGVSRRLLERRFRERLDQAPAAFIRRARIDLAKRQLLQTQDNLAQVARDAGFSHPNRMINLFQKEVGISPAAFRRRFQVSTYG